MTDASLTRPLASSAVEQSGWRLLARSLAAAVRVCSLEQGLQVAAAAVAAGSPDADEHLRVDIRADRVGLALQTAAIGVVTRRDVDLTASITDAVHALGLAVLPATGAVVSRPVQLLELAIDALDIPAIRPFWQAVLGYRDDPAESGAEASLVDPAGQLPTVWFQQMDEPRPQRNRIHLDLIVGHDEAERRLRTALAAGGVLVTDEFARSFWVLADCEGNEVCICTWQDRDTLRD